MTTESGLAIIVIICLVIICLVGLMGILLGWDQ